MAELEQVPIVILCGGRGVYVDGSGKRLSKALVPIAGEPMLVHVMRRYLRAGFRYFVLSCGRQIEELRAALSTHAGAHSADANPCAGVIDGIRCQIAVVDSGENSTTGERIVSARARIGEVPRFGVTYSDTLASVDPAAVFDEHCSHGKIATLLGTHVPTRFRILGLRRGENVVRGFAGQPVIMNDYINGGFYFFDREIWSDAYLGSHPRLVLEVEALEALAARGELIAYRFEGAWQYLDSERDVAALENLVQSLR